VKNIFRAIANIDFNLDLSNLETVQQLADEPLTYSEKFTRLSIYFLGNHPGLTQPGVPSTDADCEGSYPWMGYVVPTFGGASALMSICMQLYRELPMLQDVEKPPNWAIDPSKDQSNGPQYYDGYGCQNLGDIDSDWMRSTGAVMLHELMHFPGLFSDVPDYDATIVTTFDANTPHFIGDFWGDWPKNGYGPYNSAEIKNFLPRDHGDLVWKPVYNADNYISYALNKYYSSVCGRTFGETPSEDASWPARQPPPNPFP